MKTVYITNRGGTHPNRELYFDSIKADYQFVDFRIRWHGTSASKLKMIVSGVVCALSFPGRKNYDLFVTSDPQLPAVLMKFLGLLRKDQKIVSYLGSQTLYFIHDKFFSWPTRILYLFLLRRYDAHICNGPIQASLLQQVAGVSAEKIFTNFNGIRQEQRNALRQVEFNPKKNNLLFIGNIYSSWRIYYKGVDLILGMFNSLKKIKPETVLTLVGEYDQSIISEIQKRVAPLFHKDIFLKGKVSDISRFLNESCLYLHPSRGDALPNSLQEALFAGVPAVVSTVTGGVDTVAQIDSRLVCQLDEKKLLEAVCYFLDLSDDTKHSYSEKARVLTSELTSEAAIDRFQEIIKKIEEL